MKDVRDVRQFLGLLLDGPDDARMRMPEARHRKPAEEIKVTVAFRVVEIRAISPHKSEWKASIGIGQAFVRESDDFRVIHRADLLFDFPASRPRQNSENENVSACVYHGLRCHVSAAMRIIVRSPFRSRFSAATAIFSKKSSVLGPVQSLDISSGTNLGRLSLAPSRFEYVFPHASAKRAIVF